MGEREQEIRALAWWVSNDPYRGTENVNERDSADLDNMNALRALLNPTGPHERLMCAALEQESGRFEQALELAAAPDDAESTEYAQKLRAVISGLAQNHSLDVVKVHEPPRRVDVPLGQRVKRFLSRIWHRK